MSHSLDVAQTHKTRGIGPFLPTAVGVSVSMWVLSLAHSPIKYGSVGEEKEPRGNETLPDLDARPSDA